MNDEEDDKFDWGEACIGALVSGIVLVLTMGFWGILPIFLAAPFTNGNYVATCISWVFVVIGIVVGFVYGGKQ